MSDRVPAGENVPAVDEITWKESAFKRVLLPVQDASEAGQLVEMARRAGASEVRVLHVNLRETIGGRRFPIETDADAAYIVEAAVFELRMAGIGASGIVVNALYGKAAEAIADEAADWGADLIVLGAPRRGELTTRLFGSVSLRVLQHAHCPVLMASPTASEPKTEVAQEQYAGIGS